MRPWLVCLALLAGPASAAAADPPPADPALEVLEACRARLDAASDIGLARIEKRCPQLLSALQNAPWASLLPKDMRERRDEISAESLRELAELVRAATRELAAETPGRVPDVAKLPPLLAELGEQGQQGATRWERFKRWLQDKIERHDKDSDGASWLEEIGRQFETSEGVARLITYTGYGLMALLVLFVIWSELRAAGVLGGAARAERAHEAAEWRRRLQLTDVMNAPLAERPGLLLRLLGEALTRSSRLSAAAGLTAAALVRQARLDTDEERAELERVASAAEAVRYAARQPEQEQLEGAVSSARALLDKLARGGASMRRGR